MTKQIVPKLEHLGFTANEATLYLALVQKGPMTATAIAEATGLARTAVYPTLNSLVDQGLVDAGEGYGARFEAVPAERALPHLMLERERVTREVIEQISVLEEAEETASGELIQVIRSPRAVIERFERLQLEAAEPASERTVRRSIVLAPGRGGRVVATPARASAGRS